MLRESRPKPDELLLAFGSTVLISLNMMERSAMYAPLTIGCWPEAGKSVDGAIMIYQNDKSQYCSEQACHWRAVKVIDKESFRHRRLNTHNCSRSSRHSCNIAAVSDENRSILYSYYLVRSSC